MGPAARAVPLRMAGVKAPAGLGGRDVSALLRDPAHPGKDVAFGYWRRKGATGTTLRDDRYRLVRWKRGAEILGVELYDHRQDPDETRNVATERGVVVERLLRRLASGAPVLPRSAPSRATPAPR